MCNGNKIKRKKTNHKLEPVAEVYLSGDLLKDEMIHDFVAPPRGLRKIEVSHINKGSSPLAVLMLSFTGIFQ